MIREVSDLVANSNFVLLTLGQSPMLCLQEQQYHPAVDAECADDMDMFLEVPKGGSQTDALREDWLWKDAQHQYSPCHSFSKID